MNVHSDNTTLRKYIPTGIKIRFDFERNDDNFSLLSHDTTKNYLIELGEMKMSCKRYKPGKVLHDFYENQLKLRKNPTLAIDRSLIKAYVVNKGTTDLSTYNLIRGSQLPEQVIIGVVPQESYNGSLNTNPFNFKHYDIREASLIVNGVNEPVELYKLDVNKGDKADMFASFLDNTGFNTDDREF